MDFILFEFFCVCYYNHGCRVVAFFTDSLDIGIGECFATVDFVTLFHKGCEKLTFQLDGVYSYVDKDFKSVIGCYAIGMETFGYIGYGSVRRAVYIAVCGDDRKSVSENFF